MSDDQYRALAKAAIHAFAVAALQDEQQDYDALESIAQKRRAKPNACMPDYVTKSFLDQWYARHASYQDVADLINTYFSLQGIESDLKKGSFYAYQKSPNGTHPSSALEDQIEPLAADLRNRLQPKHSPAHRKIDYFTNDDANPLLKKAVDYVISHPTTLMSVDDVYGILRARQQKFTGVEIAKRTGWCYAQVYIVLNAVDGRLRRYPSRKTVAERARIKQEEEAMVESVRKLGFAAAVKANSHTKEEYLDVLRQRAPELVKQLYQELTDNRHKIVFSAARTQASAAHQ